MIDIDRTIDFDKMTYLHQVDDDIFEQIAQIRHEDNKETTKLLHDFATNKFDKQLNFTLLNLGQVLQIVAISLSLKENEIESAMKLKKDKARDKKMQIILKELNERINTRYGFDDKTVVVPLLYTYGDLGYIFINKALFISLLIEKDIDFEELGKI